MRIPVSGEKERFPVWPCGTGAGSFGVYREDRLEKYKVLKEYFGYDGFRPGQEALIGGILGGQDVLGIMPTGAGKSICYQVPALLLPGITIVISPLISLMKDQVRGLNEAGIHAAYINSSLTEGQIRKAMELAGQGRYKIIYVAPERLLSGLFQEFLSRAEISMVTVDEAHCISQWGQDFRPSYLNIVHMIAGMKRRPVVSAFTATATEEVKNDILCVLGLQNPRVLVTGFDRENLYFEVRSGGQKDQELLQYVQEHRKESGIIYCATRKNVEAVCELLKKTGIPAVRYHAGLSPQERKYNQDLFIFDEQPVMVATNAFGMGIDKSNVRYVIHYNMPQSMENYYQEAGRAGRDGERAECILLYSPQDVRINQFLLEEKEFREEMTKEEQEAVRERDAQRLKLMAFYCTTRDCLRGYILRYFGEKTKRRCENCSNCLKEYTEEDVTNICKSILSCIREARRSYGAGTIAAVLHGSKSEKIRGYGLDRLTSYGTQAEVAEYRLREIIGELTAKGVLRSTDDKYATLRLTQAAEKILEGQEAVVMKFSRAEEKKAPAQKKKKQTSGDLDAAGWQLFERLRELRMQIARAEKVPPYIVFTDKTLMDMCLKKPKNRAEMLSVSGVGAAKYEKYGEQFLEGIRGR